MGPGGLGLTPAIGGSGCWWHRYKVNRALIWASEQQEQILEQVKPRL